MYLTMNGLGVCLWIMSILIVWTVAAMFFDSLPEWMRDEGVARESTITPSGLVACLVLVGVLYVLFCQFPKFH